MPIPGVAERPPGEVEVVDVQPRRGSIIDISRSVSNNETGVFVIDQFPGSGKQWPFKVLEVTSLLDARALPAGCFCGMSEPLASACVFCCPDLPHELMLGRISKPRQYRCISAAGIPVGFFRALGVWSELKGAF